MNKEETLKEILAEFFEVIPDFKKIFMSLGHNNAHGAPKLTSLQYLTVLVLGVASAEPITMNALASILNISKQQTTKLVDGLVEARLVERYTNQENRREVLTELSMDGYDCLAKIRQAKYESLLALTDDYSEAELVEVLGHIRGIKSVLSRKTVSDN